jgi:hypothetical protein
MSGRGKSETSDQHGRASSKRGKKVQSPGRTPPSKDDSVLDRHRPKKRRHRSLPKEVPNAPKKKRDKSSSRKAQKKAQRQGQKSRSKDAAPSEQTAAKKAVGGIDEDVGERVDSPTKDKASWRHSKMPSKYRPHLRQHENQQNQNDEHLAKEDETGSEDESDAVDSPPRKVAKKKVVEKKKAASHHDLDKEPDPGSETEDEVDLPPTKVAQKPKPPFQNEDSDNEDENEQALPTPRKGAEHPSPTNDDQNSSCSLSSSDETDPKEARASRLKKRHDPTALEKKKRHLNHHKAKEQKKKDLLAEQAKNRKKMDENDTVSFRNEQRLFNEYYNRTLRKKLRNHQRNDNEEEAAARMEDAVKDVDNYLLQQYPAAEDVGCSSFVEASERVQKLIYEPPTDPGQTVETFTVIHEDGSKARGVTYEWLVWALGPLPVYAAFRTGKRIDELNGKQHAFTLPSGDSNADSAPVSCLVKSNKRGSLKKIKYRQRDKDYCFMYSFASALHYIGKCQESRIVANQAEKISNMSLVDQLKHLVQLVRTKMPNISPKSKDGYNLKGATLEQLLEAATKEELMLVVPKGKGKSTTHAVTVCMGLVFDSTQEYPLTVSSESFNFVAGSTGFEKTYMTRSFVIR